MDQPCVEQQQSLVFVNDNVLSLSFILNSTVLSSDNHINKKANLQIYEIFDNRGRMKSRVLTKSSEKMYETEHHLPPFSVGNQFLRQVVKEISNKEGCLLEIQISTFIKPKMEKNLELGKSQ